MNFLISRKGDSEVKLRKKKSLTITEVYFLEFRIDKN